MTTVKNTAVKQRDIVEQIRARAASDGDGVKLKRVFGGERPERFDPFLMLDEFGSDEAADYIGGFPPHPHRGFETVTYMLEGKMEHRDHMGNVGLINDGDVQWMTAGKGIIHSEMPKQTEGKMRGFQLWVNLPAKRKLIPANYNDIDGAAIPMYAWDGLQLKAFSGKTEINANAVTGYLSVKDTEALFVDIHLQPGAVADIALTNGHNALAYVYDGGVTLGEKQVVTRAQTLTRFSGNGNVVIQNKGKNVARVLMLSGKPLKEPIVQHGPFVMNSSKEIQQAIADYQAGRLAS
ncbi:pirin family protein [Teredinibacter purpureus]|uniref:pirin family protein n=1 Tax=Teredinibacter purpureus TaxID=2731756 RepID=UPI0005F7AF2B|nr:pirin family protein [Teredinibacter purpureus]